MADVYWVVKLSNPAGWVTDLRGFQCNPDRGLACRFGTRDKALGAAAGWGDLRNARLVKVTRKPRRSEADIRREERERIAASVCVDPNSVSSVRVGHGAFYIARSFRDAIDGLKACILSFDWKPEQP